MSTVAVVIPAYNEGDGFRARLVRLADYFAPHDAYEFTYHIVDDGSTDGTRDACEAFARYRRNVDLLLHDRRRGLGGALRHAFARIASDFTIVMAGAVPFSPVAAMDLLEVLDRSGADVASASQYAKGARWLDGSFLQYVARRCFNQVFSLATRRRYLSFTCGFRAYRTQFLKRLTFEGEGQEVSAQIMFAALRAGGHIVELPARKEWDAPELSSVLVQQSHVILPHGGLHT